MIALAQRNRGPRLNVTFRKMDGANIVYPDETFHAVAAIQSAHHWVDPASILLEVHRVLRTGHSFYIYEADADASEVPRGWIHRRGPWPPDRYVLKTWRRYGMNSEAWNELKSHVRSSPFGGGEDGRHGFYRRLVLTR
jgi:ubiquinone/menaquinone biosynthesis C-methylase UbiE